MVKYRLNMPKDVIIYPGNPSERTVSKGFVKSLQHNTTHLDLWAHLVGFENKAELSGQKVSLKALIYVVGRHPLIERIKEEKIRGYDAVLFYTGVCKELSERKSPLKRGDYPRLSLGVTEALIRNGIRYVGTDSGTIGDREVHEKLFKNNVLPIEGLNFSKIPNIDELQKDDTIKGMLEFRIPPYDLISDAVGIEPLFEKL